MDPNVPNVGPELPTPSEKVQSTETAEIGFQHVEAVGNQAQPNQLSEANNAVNSATNAIMATAQLPAGQDDNSQITAQPPSNMMADDVDVIEKVWVQKAKAIVESTKDDPFKQSTGLSQVKSDYIKKRYDKDIKVAK